MSRHPTIAIDQVVGQIGPRYRRRRIAIATKMAATSSPVQSPGWLKKLTGISSAMISMCTPGAIETGAGGPARRDRRKDAKCGVPKVIFSTIEITNGGKKAHMNGAREAQAETIKNQP